jgi:crotonobetainyl-CoA:carnitine CoA-transferase CaiB-like acyl-CoA transferase
MAMLDVAMILMASHVTGYLRNGKHPKPLGSRMPHAISMTYQTAEGIVMLGASNLRQQKRLWTALERPDLITRTNDERDADYDREVGTLTELVRSRTAGVVGRVFAGTPRSGIASAQHGRSPGGPAAWIAWSAASLRQRPGIPGTFTVPVTAFKFGHGGPRVDRPPPLFGQHNEEVLTELGYSPSDIAGFRSAKII